MQPTNLSARFVLKAKSSTGRISGVAVPLEKPGLNVRENQRCNSIHRLQRTAVEIWWIECFRASAQSEVGNGKQQAQTCACGDSHEESHAPFESESAGDAGFSQPGLQTGKNSCRHIVIGPASSGTPVNMIVQIAAFDPLLSRLLPSQSSETTA